jgi:hypothetical protein
MLYLYGMPIQDVMYEGLIKSVPIKDAILKLNKVLEKKANQLHSSLYIMDTLDHKKIVIILDRAISITELDVITKIADVLGWFCSGVVVRDKNYKFNYTFVVDTIKYGLPKHSINELWFEAKYDIGDDNIGDYLYHATPIKNKSIIDKIGLVPKMGLKRTYHPSRIYFAKDIATIDVLTKQLASHMRYGVKEYIVYKLDVKQFIDENPDVKFYKDPNLETGVYTVANIAPKYLSNTKTISL